jgi:hypothetical protein
MMRLILLLLHLVVLLDVVQTTMEMEQVIITMDWRVEEQVLEWWEIAVFRQHVGTPRSFASRISAGFVAQVQHTDVTVPETFAFQTIVVRKNIYV